MLEIPRVKDSNDVSICATLTADRVPPAGDAQGETGACGALTCLCGSGPTGAEETLVSLAIRDCGEKTKLICH